jgi:hypothetical protein
MLWGCGYDPSGDVAGPAEVTSTTSTTSTTTTLPPGGRQPTSEDPLRVVFAGDSVMADLAPAAIDALNRGGATEAKFILAPGVSTDPATEVLWRQQLDSFDPEVVVLLVGTWETKGGLGSPDAPGWRARYDTEILDPFVELVTGDGAELIWIGMPAVVDPQSTLLLTELNMAYAALSDRFDAVTYIDGGEYVSAPTGGFAEFLDGPGGLERVRRVDGLHLCPDGSTRLSEPVLDEVVTQWNVPVADDWRQGDWRLPPALLKPEECPPV